MADSKPIVVNTNQNVENLSKSLRDIIRDRLLEHLEASRAEHADIGVQVEPDHLGNQDKVSRANKLYEMALTAALTENDLCKAETLLIKSSQVCPRETVTMMLEKVRSEMAHISGPRRPPKCPRKSQPNVEIVDKLIEIAKKAIKAKDLEKAEIFLKKAKELKPTAQIQRLLQEVKILIDEREKLEETRAAMIPEKLYGLATNAIDADEYDVAELLLKTAWIQYKSESAKQMLDVLIQICEGLDQNITTKFIANTTTLKQCSVSIKYHNLAKHYIAEGQLKIAELMLIISKNIYIGSNVENSEENRKMHTSLYKNKSQYNVKAEWKLTNDLQTLGPVSSIEAFRCDFFLRMAYRAFHYADNPKLAQDFLMEARKSTNIVIRNYTERYLSVVNKKL